MTTSEFIAAVSAGAALISGLFGGGLLKRHIDSAKVQAVQQYILDQLSKDMKETKEKVADMERENAAVSAKIDRFEKSLDKLDLIPDINAKLAATQRAVESLQDIVGSIAAHRGE